MGWVEQHGQAWRGVYRDRAGHRHKSPPFMHKARAQVWADEHTEQVAAGVDRDPRRGRMLLRDFADQWAQARAVERTTAASDAGRLRLLLDEFGDRPLEHLDALAIQGWARKLRREGRAPATVAKYVHLLSGILSAAVLAQRIPDNPCRYVRLDPPAPAKETYLSREQVDRLIAAMDDGMDALAVHLLAYTGLRWGEAVGLHRNRVDFLRRRIEVAEVVTEVAGARQVKGYPKGRARRWVPLPAHLLDALARAFTQSPARCGLEAVDSAGLTRPHRCTGLVLVTASGGVLSRHTWGRDRFKPALAAAELPADVRVHDLRHSYASWCAGAGVPMRELQRRLGHQSITTTERYAHFCDVGEPNLAGLERPAVRLDTAR